METEINQDLNVQENNRSLKQKIIIIILLGLVFILILGMVFMYFYFKKNMSCAATSKLENSQKFIRSPETANNQEIKIPENQIIGKIKETSPDKITVTLSLIYSPGNNQRTIDKEVARDQVDEIKKLVKNPNFDAEKAKQAQAEIQKKYEQDSNAFTEPLTENKQLAENGTLSPFIEEVISWEELAVGNQVTYQSDPSGSGEKVLIVLSVIPSEITPSLNSNGNINDNK